MHSIAVKKYILFIFIAKKRQSKREGTGKHSQRNSSWLINEREVNEKPNQIDEDVWLRLLRTSRLQSNVCVCVCVCTRMTNEKDTAADVQYRIGVLLNEEEKNIVRKNQQPHGVL